MPSALPRSEVLLNKAPTPANPQDLSCFPCVVGACSAGPLNDPTKITSLDDLADFGYGPAVEMAAEILKRAGGPVILTRTATTTASTLSSVLKVPATAPTAGALYGGILLPGADADGEVFATAKQAGLSVVMVDPSGNNVALSGAYADGVVTITLATDGSSVITTTGTLLAAYINASLSTYLSAVAQGTGASLVTALASTAISNGDVSYLARQDGVTVRHVASGNATSLSVSVATKAVTVNLATDANGTPTSTAAQVAAAVVASSAAKLLLTPTASGDGSGKAGVWSAQTLNFGSSGALSLSGTPVDRFDLVFVPVKAGTVGGTTAPTVKWSLDGGNHFTAPKLIPGTGILVLDDTAIESGVTATFTGALAVDDKWYASSTAPVSSISEIGAGVDAALADTLNRFGFIACPHPVSRSNAGEVDTDLQAALQKRFPAALLSAREETTGERDSDTAEAVALDFQGYTSTRGLVRLCYGYASHQSSYTGRRYWRPLAFLAAARRAKIPVHEDLGKVDSGPLAGLGDAYPGKLLVAGADSDGGVLYQARVSGVSVMHQISGNSTLLNVSVDTETLEITVICATDSGGVVTSTADDIVAAVNAVNASAALVTASPQGTGNSLTAAKSMTRIVDRVISHDEYLSETMHGERFITTRTYDERPGSYYLTQGPTMADPSETGYTLIKDADVMLSIGRIAKDTAFVQINDSLPYIGAAESDAVPAGALVAAEAVQVSNDISSPILRFLTRPKSDGKPSASPYEPGEKPCTVRRDYSYASTRQLRMDISARLKGITEVVTISVTPTVP